MDFEPSVKVLDCASVDESHLAVLIGNILDNAYDAVKHLSGNKDKLRIELKVIGVNNSLVITLDNPFSGQVNKTAKGFVSNKDGHPGLGLVSVERIAKLYGGEAKFSFDSANSDSRQLPRFHSSIILYLN